MFKGPRRAVLGLFALACVAAIAVPASAGAFTVTGGKSKLALDPDTAEAFADMSIGIEPTGAAKFSQGFFKFPIKGGEVDEGPKGEIQHKGGISFFTEGGPGVKFTQPIVKIGKSKAKVFAKSSHAAVRLFDLDLSGATIGGSGGQTLKIKNADTTLAKAGAGVLSETFNFPFMKGTEIGTMSITATLGG